MASDFTAVCESGKARSDIWDSPSGEARRATGDNSASERKTVRSGVAYDINDGMGSAESSERAKRLKEELGSVPVSGIEGRVAYRFLKRAFDIVFSAGVVLMLAVPVAAACVAICLETPGAPVYAQERVGMNGRVIRVLKLRSMVVDAGDVEKYLSPGQLRQWQVERKVDDDPRVTRVGGFIRKTSLDELPQFLNVLTGDLAVIGPRPITEAELDQHFTAAEREELLSVRPGITGLWQATERNEATFESGRRQQIELRYVRDRGFAMDARCFFGTFGAMFGKKATGR